MNTLAWVLMGVAAVLAVCDWVAVGTGNRRAEFVFKPATMVPLVVTAAVVDPARSSEQWWFVAALVLSLAGDVFLMLPNEEKWFVPGLASFLVGHLAYIGGMWSSPLDATGLVVGTIVVAVLTLGGAPYVIRGAMRTDRRLGLPVLAYNLVIGVMVVSAIGSQVALAIVGAVLFLLSDFTIGWSRFVKDFPGARLVIITTYHAAQALLVLSLTAS